MAFDFNSGKKTGFDFSKGTPTKVSDLPASPVGAPTDSGFKLPGQDTAQSIATGVTKGVAVTLSGLAKTGKAILSPIANMLGGQEQLSNPSMDTLDKVSKPVGTAENIGFYGEKAAEFLTPGGIEKSAISAGDKVIEGLNLVKQLGPTIGKTASVALKGVVRALTGGASGTIVGTAQTGDLKKGEEMGIANAIASPLLEGVVSLMPKAADALQKVSMRLTPAQKRDFGGKLVDITDYMQKNNIVGTAKQQSEKMDTLFSKTEKTIQKVFEDNPDRFVSKEEAKTMLGRVKEEVARDNPDAQSAMKQVDDAIANLDFQYGTDKIPLARFNELKRSTFASAFNRAGTKVLGDVEFAIGEAEKTLIEKASEGLKYEGKDIGAFNKDYGSLINARKIMAAAESRSPRLFERVMSTIVGGVAGSVVPGVGTTAGAISGLVGGQLIEKPLIDLGTSAASNIMSRSTPAAILKAAPKVTLPYITR